ncbi:uncharacterized protein [Antedon mediterranea]|uniref:uncharacterized protein n=1 Tax=Antedon mediterranea TaxID=105859 RepID=UPI003AF4CD8B
MKRSKKTGRFMKNKKGCVGKIENNKCDEIEEKKVAAENEKFSKTSITSDRVSNNIAINERIKVNKDENTGKVICTTDLNDDSCTIITHIAQGNFNQGDFRFGNSAGKQCVANALISMLYLQKKNVFELKPCNLDEILTIGNELYYYIQKDSTMNEELLLVTELPKELNVLDDTFRLNYSESTYGILEGNHEEFSLCVNLGQALQKALCNSGACFMNFHGCTFAIIKNSSGYFVFDSHSRNYDGYLIPNGRSVLLYISSLRGIEKHCIQLAKSMGCQLHTTQFEITGLNIKIASIAHETNSFCNKQDNLTNQNQGVQPSSCDYSSTLNTQYSACIMIDSDNIIDVNECCVADLNYLSNNETLGVKPEIEKEICDEVLNNGKKTHKFENDIEIVSVDRLSERNDKYFRFLPVHLKDKIKLCEQFKIENSVVSCSPNLIENETKNMYIGKPTHITKIMGDGNCFYRCVAYLISGTQINHLVLRQAIVNHLLQTNDTFKSTLQEGYGSVREYVFKQRVMNSGTWACDIEISAMANMLDFDIYTYNDQGKYWQIFSARKPGFCNKVTTERGIYILYTGGNHFDAVEAVANVNYHSVEQIDLNVLADADSNSDKELLLEENYKVQEENTDVSKQTVPNINYNHVEEVQVILNADSNSDEELLTEKHIQVQDEHIRVLKQIDKKKYEQSKSLYSGDKSCNKKTITKNKKSRKKSDDLKRKLDKERKRIRRQEFKEIMKQHRSMKYEDDPNFRENVKEIMKNYRREKYENDPCFRENVKETMKNYGRENYENDPCFRENFKETMKNYRREKYENDPCFRENVKETMKNYGKEKYENDPCFRENVKETMKNYGKEKYENDPCFRENVKETMKNYGKEKYENDQEFRKKVEEKNVKQKQCAQVKLKKFENVLNKFREMTSNGPEYVCCVCLKLLFRKQVMICLKTKYKVQSCINDKYLHICNYECNNDCEIAKSSMQHLWVCFTCHRKLLNGDVPAEAFTNNLQLEDIPKELVDLNNLEQHLIAINIPFMKILNLPKGGQNGIHGPVVCVPSNTVETVTMLPRTQTDDQMIRVKLKRKLSYKGYYEYKYVSKSKVIQALQYLQHHNKWYSDVFVNEDWNSDLSNNLNEKKELLSFNEEEGTEDELNSRLCGVQLDTCLQRIDMRQEILDNYFDHIIACAPCEGNSPVALLNNESNEGKCFPRLYPTGKGTFHDFRSVKLTLGRYFLNRLMHVDNRFARNTEYLFFSQCLYEIQQVISSVSIALRKGSDKKDDFKPVKVSDLKNINKVEEILKSDKGFKFLKQIRGTPPYWQATQKDVLAMIRQLGKPTWFASFSSADMRWPEIIKTLLIQTGNRRKLCDLDWTDKCNLLKSNPVTVARMFDKRFHSFLKHVILSCAFPIGKVIDYFYRVEFQNRGSPHCHCLFWVENAPRLGIDKDEEVTKFIDKYVSCELPSKRKDAELHEIVSNVQIHSKSHSKSCKKKGTKCRFNFPRPPSEKTFVINPIPKDERETDDPSKGASSILSEVKNLLNDEILYDDVKQLFNDMKITQKRFEEANNMIAKRQDFILKRNPKDAWVNQYNPELLRAWNANMDLQYVSNEYACVAYVVSYMSKAEREMGLLLSSAESEMKDGNEDARQSLRKLGNVYMQNREVSAQESVFRVCSLRLKEGSRKVEFIPVGPNPIRMSLPLSVIKTKEDDEEIVWMPNKLDRYRARPDGHDFDNMCLAAFCSYFRIIKTSETNTGKQKKNVFKLKNKLGYIQKRSRSANAVLRYPRFVRDISPEKYYLSLMQLFLPFRIDEQLKPPQFVTYEEFYEKGFVRLNGSSLKGVKSIVHDNLQQYEKNADKIDQAQDYIEKFGIPEDAWGLLCPESEVERLTHPKPNVNTDDIEDEFNIPDLCHEKKKMYTLENPSLSSINVLRQVSNKMIRSLNKTQQQLFYKIRQWCLDKLNGKEPGPFNIFISGGAGTGKSHVVKCIFNEGTRILGKMMQKPDDVSILKVAPTGIAAYNINGKTIHSALSIPVNVSFPYQPLGEEKINQLRNYLCQLQILIIDEISMVDQKLLWYIHGRLRQIKQSRDDSPFGKVSIIAVGDFYQLPPVKGMPLYAQTIQGALWIDNFEKVNLDEIMRQKGDAEFAILLNKLRILERGDILSDESLAILKSRETGEQCEDALHIYSYNRDVNTWNKEMLHNKCTDVICIEAQDTELNRANKNKLCDKPCKSNSQTSLISHLWLAPNARIMLIKNVDVDKGMTNGCMGSVLEIIQSCDNKPISIKVKFDNDAIGTQTIERFQESMGKKYTRKQFPLKLAYACTVHKVQGMTLDKAVINLKNTFLSGQAYVALSRVTSISRLVIENFHPKHIHCDGRVKHCLHNMKSFPYEYNDNYSKSTCSIILHNVQGLKQHFADLQCNRLFLNSDFICLTETWLSKNDSSFDISLDTFNLYHQPRYNCYTNATQITSEFKDKEHGGVAVYAKSKYFSRLNINVKDIEFIAFMLTSPKSVVVSVIYRPPGYNVKQFCKSLEMLLLEFHKLSTSCIVMGDFNEDLLKNTSQVYTLMINYNYKQVIECSTTEGGTLLDLVFVRDLDCLNTTVLPIYYSYHEAIRIQF